MRTSTVRTVSLIAGLVFLLSTLVSAPATAEPRKLIVTLLGGKVVTVTVDADPSTPVESLPLPDLGLPVVSISEAGGSVTAAPTAPPVTETVPPVVPTMPTTPTETTPSTVPTTPGTTTLPPTTIRQPPATGGVVKPKGQPKGESPAVAVPRDPAPPPGAQGGAILRDSAEADVPEDAIIEPQPTSPEGAQPTPSTPGFTFAPLGPAPVGVPNLLIDQFRIPPFLLSIYQAAGIQYGIPWQILAAINEIETDYGRNLSVSSAGALGWMQFMPSSWEAYGVDANGDGIKDPYNPADAIFAAGRYLKAAGADQDLERAIFAYNHADWYVDSVLLRARVIGGLPADLVGSLTGLTQGRFPVAARATYAGGIDARRATRRVDAGNAAVPIEGDPTRRTINVFARRGAPVIAVNDGEIVKLGENERLGRFVVLEDVYGNRYTYSGLGSVAEKYPVPKPRRADRSATAHELEPPADERPSAPASAGTTRPGADEPAASGARTRRDGRDGRRDGAGPPAPVAEPRRLAANGDRGTARETVAVAKERLFANPSRPAAYRAGGREQIEASGEALETFDGYFTDALNLDPDDYVLKPLRVGSSVIGGTVLGRIGKVDERLAPHVAFAIRPAGRDAPRIDPKPILDGWKLLESTAIYRAEGKNPFFGRGARHPSIGQILLMSKEELQQRVLANPNVEVYGCGRRDIEAGIVDRRVLATLEFLASSGLRPTVSSLQCGHGYYTSSGNVSAHSSGNAVDIAAVNGITITPGTQGADSITDITIRRLLTLQGTMKPNQIISLMTYPGTDNTLALPDHDDHIHVGFAPTAVSSGALEAALDPKQWTTLVERLNEIPNPVVPTKPSRYAIKDGRGD